MDYIGIIKKHILFILGTIPGCNARTLCKIAKKLCKREIQFLATNLGIGREKAEMMMKKCKSDELAAFKILIHYRGKRPFASQVDKIVNVLCVLNREDLASILSESKQS